MSETTEPPDLMAALEASLGIGVETLPRCLMRGPSGQFCDRAQHEDNIHHTRHSPGSPSWFKGYPRWHTGLGRWVRIGDAEYEDYPPSVLAMFRVPVRGEA